MTTAPPPDSSTPPKSMPAVDRTAASRAAVAARRARAAVKEAVRTGERSPLDVAEAAWRDPQGVEGGMRVRDLVATLKGLGPTRTLTVLDRLGIAPVKRLGGLGHRQRAALREWLKRRAAVAGHGSLVVLAGPTAVGKGAVSAYIRENFPDVLLSVSATTRAPRQGEEHGVHYFFVDDAEFDAMVDRDEFLEWAAVHNLSRYGTPRSPVEAALASGRSVLLEIDLDGARQVRAAMPEATLVFLLPPSWEELVRRLVGRGTESSQEQARRLETAKIELAAQGEFDVLVVNDDVRRAAAEVVDLLAVPGAPSRA